MNFSFRFFLIMVKTEFFLIGIFCKHKFLVDSYFCKCKRIIPISHSWQDIQIYMIPDTAFRKKSRNDEPVNSSCIVFAYITAAAWRNLGSFLSYFGPVSPVSHKTNGMVCFILYYSHYTTPLS
ncbi:predicted protein [Methanosarcina acetivorans C2A]|uniref:Uncharacterized protein n=1 Tax=Methanosarcina acetivorans (strain ATCC 35395 / DSM 2834 / JCM 12185 / C2A) TaxID=188937 RepID=Q8TPV1_METAC|nr:predicted protein [Methanosarcina acetivorans C2A]